MILILILHLIKKQVSSFVWISCLHLIFSINLMIACLWNVLKCPFSLASDTESIRISFSSLQNYFVDRSLPLYLEVYHFECFLENPILFFQLNLLQKGFALSSESFEILIWLRKLLTSITVFCSLFLKRIS